MFIDMLFWLFQLKGLMLVNWIVMVLMICVMVFEGILGKVQVDYYSCCVVGEVGLILIEGMVIDRFVVCNLLGILFFYGDVVLVGWVQVVCVVYEVGGKIGLQIWYMGLICVGEWQFVVLVESFFGLVGFDDLCGVVMIEEDIVDMVVVFVKVVQNVKVFGFDVVELYGVYGYLIDQFFWSGMNLCYDVFGGVLICECVCFVVEVVCVVCVVVGLDFLLLLCVSQWKQQDYGVWLVIIFEEMIDWLLLLVEVGVDVLYCFQWCFWELEFVDLDLVLNFVGWVKKLIGVVMISVGLVGLNFDFLLVFIGKSLEQLLLDDLIVCMDCNEFDLIVVGCVLILDLNWVQKVCQGD